MAPEKGIPKYPYAYARDLKKYLIDDKIPLEKLLLENEMAISGKSEKEVWEFLDQVAEVMIRGVEAGLETEGILPGPIKLHSKAAQMHRNLPNTKKGIAGRAISQVAAYAFAMSEENARGHIIVTAPTAGSSGIIPAVLKSLRDINIPERKFVKDSLPRQPLATSANTMQLFQVLKVVARQRLELVLPWVLQ